MNILCYTPTPSHPQSAGNRSRIYKQAKFLQDNGHKIHFVYYTTEGLNLAQHREMLNDWDTFDIIIYDRNKIKIRTDDYFLADDWYQDGIGEIIGDLCIKYNIDVVLCNYIFQSKLLEYLPDRILKIIDTHDRMSDRHIMLKENNIELEFFYTTKEEEGKAFDRADIIFAIQEKEADFFSTLTNKKVIAIPHYEEKNYINREYSELKKIGFVSSHNNVNYKSLMEFLDKFHKFYVNEDIKLEVCIAGNVCDRLGEVNYKIESQNKFKKIIGWGTGQNFRSTYPYFPLKLDYLIDNDESKTGTSIQNLEIFSSGKLKEENPDDTAIVIFSKFGDQIKSQIKELGAFKTFCPAEDIVKECANIEKYISKRGYLENLDDFYEEMDLIISPITFGTGLNIKTVEALVRGVPVISTGIGFKGIESDEEMHQRTNLDEIIQDIKTIYENPYILNHLSCQSKLVYDNYIEMVTKNLNEVFNIQCLESKRQRMEIF